MHFVFFLFYDLDDWFQMPLIRILLSRHKLNNKFFDPGHFINFDKIFLIKYLKAFQNIILQHNGYKCT